MRSDLVHSASKRLNNRFLLCRMAALAARRMHTYKRHYAESINEGLTHIADLPKESSGTAVTEVSARETISVQTSA